MDDIVNKVIEQYYQSIYNYCYAKLNFNHANAEDCTQEVFLILMKKYEILNLSDNVKIWLYRTADNVIKAYRRKNMMSDKTLDIDEIDITVNNDFEIVDDNRIFDNISDEDYKLLEAYYNSEYGDKEEVASQFNLTIHNLYKRIHKIKSKLKR